MDRDIYFFGKSAYVTYKFLIDRGIPESTIYNNTSSKKSKTAWYVASLPENKKKKLIAYDSIPLTIIRKYNLPDLAYLRDLSDHEKKKLKEKKKENVSNLLKSSLDFEYYNWKEIIPLYQNKFLNGEKLESFCKTHVILSKIIELREFGYRLNTLYNAYYQYDDLIFQTDNYRSFCNKIREIKKRKNIDDVLIHGLSNQPSNNLKKEEDVIIEIKAQYFNGKKPNAQTILNKVNEYLSRTNRETISMSSIYSVISNIETKNEAALIRHGEKYVKNKMLPKMHFTPPSKEGLLWLMDGTRFQFVYKTAKKKYNFLTFFIVLEGYNREIIGYSFDDSENSNMAKKAIAKACSATGYIPYELISDNSSAYKTDDMVKIRALFKLWGSDWRIVKDNPQDNGYAERAFGVFQESFCKTEDGYLGDGSTSRNLNGKPSPEELKANLLNKKIRTKEELIKVLENLIYDYNNSDKRKKLVKEAIIQENTEDKLELSPIVLNYVKFGQLFWEKRTEKVRNGEISFDINTRKHYYHIYDEDLLVKIHGTNVLVRYNPDDLSKILIFDIKTDKFHICLKELYIPPKAKIERTDDENKAIYQFANNRRNILNSLRNRIKRVKEQSDKNKENLPPVVIGYNMGSKKEINEAKDDLREEELSNMDPTNKKDDDASNFDKIFKNLYTTKGTLKLFKHGKN